MQREGALITNDYHVIIYNFPRARSLRLVLEGSLPEEELGG